MKPAATKERFIELRAEGLSYSDIASEIHVSKQTLIAWSKELSREVKNARSVHMDGLFQRFAVAKTKRIEVFGRRLEAMLTELDTRDLSEVSTRDLLKLVLDYGARLKTEETDLTITGDEPQTIDLDFMGFQTLETWKI